jgi:hypothetical protein
MRALSTTTRWIVNDALDPRPRSSDSASIVHVKNL